MADHVGVPYVPVGRRPAPDRLPPHGREVELDAVRHLLTTLQSGAGAGAGAVVVVVGGPGSGKTRLLEETVALARQTSVRVGVGGARPGDRVVELSTMLQAVFEGASPVLPPAAAPALRGSLEQRYWVLQDLRELLAAAALEAPILICLDDLQWADLGTVAALRALPTRLSDLPIGWVIATRPPREAPELARIIRTLVGHGAQRLDLGPLDRSAIARVTHDAFSAAPSDELLELAFASRGDPFTLTELLAGLREERLVRVEGGGAALVAFRLPARLRDSMRERLSRLTPLARDVAVVAASLAPTFTVGAVGALLDVTPAAALAAVEEVAAAEVFREDGHRLAFWHDLTRDAVRGSIPMSARRALDRQAADVLMADGALPVEVALQLAASAEPGDRHAVTVLRAAAQDMSGTDPGSAADLGRRALDLAPPQYGHLGELVGETTVWIHAAGRIEEAQAFADEALRTVLDPEQEAQVRLSVAGLLELPPDVLVETGRKALALHGVSQPLRDQHLARLIWNLFVGGRYGETAESLPATRREMGPDCSPSVRFVLDLVQSGLEHIDGHLDAALSTIDSALAAVPDHDDVTREHVARMWRLSLLFLLDRPDEATSGTVDAIAQGKRDRQAWALTIYRILRGRLAFAAGRPTEAIEALDELLPLDVADTGGVIHAAGVVALGLSALHVGDGTVRRRTAELARLMAGGTTPGVQRLAGWFLARLAMADNDPQAAHAWLCVVGDDERFNILRVLQASPTDEVELVRIAMAAGDPELARHAVDTATRRAALNPGLRTVAGAAAHARGLAEHSQEDLSRAVALYERGPRPLALASALEDLGAAPDVERDGAVAALDRALRLWSDAGAEWDVRRVRQRLRAHGVRRRLVAKDRPQSGWTALTEAEAKIARLVAEGLTNRQVADRLFISSHTVDSHLRHVYNKLQISSRVELAHIVSSPDRQLGGPTPSRETSATPDAGAE